MEKPMKKRAETSLKASIIEFMRQRPFLWNPRHPSYKDNKRRDREFQEFAIQMECPVREIKRVWHVLRTNFFRAHKLRLDKPPTETGRPESGLWKYYLAMEYILKGKHDGFLAEKHAESSGTESCSPAPIKFPSTSDISQSLTLHIVNGGLSNTRDLNGTSPSNNTNSSDTNISPLAPASNLNTSSTAEPNNQPTSDATRDQSHSHNINSNNCHSNLNKAPVSKQRKPASCLPQQAHHHIGPQAYNYFYPVDDEDYLYARSLGATLKRFDFKTRELIKLKFQEIIVSQTQQLHQDDINTVLH